jgi:polyhydroxyalkanoate synthesis regulator phasin
MQEERRKILEMVASGKITVEEAERLMSALEKDGDIGEPTSSEKSRPKYLRILVEPKADSENGDRVNVRVPINLIRAGLKWASFIPNHSQKKVGDALKEKGINVDLGTLTPDDLDELIVNLNDLQVDVDGEEVVKVYCE